MAYTIKCFSRVDKDGLYLMLGYLILGFVFTTIPDVASLLHLISLEVLVITL